MPLTTIKIHDESKTKIKDFMTQHGIESFADALRIFIDLKQTEVSQAATVNPAGLDSMIKQARLDIMKQQLEAEKLGRELIESQIAKNRSQTALNNMKLAQFTQGEKPAINPPASPIPPLNNQGRATFECRYGCGHLLYYDKAHGRPIEAESGAEHYCKQIGISAQTNNAIPTPQPKGKQDFSTKCKDCNYSLESKHFATLGDMEDAAFLHARRAHNRTWLKEQEAPVELAKKAGWSE